MATRNRHKQKEIRAIFGASKKWRLLFLDRYPNAPHPKETGKTFDENAVLKARAVARYAGLPSVSDGPRVWVRYLPPFSSMQALSGVQEKGRLFSLSTQAGWGYLLYSVDLPSHVCLGHLTG